MKRMITTALGLLCIGTCLPMPLGCSHSMKGDMGWSLTIGQPFVVKYEQAAPDDGATDSYDFQPLVDYIIELRKQPPPDATVTVTTETAP